MVVGATLNSEGETDSKKHLSKEMGGIVPISGLRNVDVCLKIKSEKIKVFIIRMHIMTL